MSETEQRLDIWLWRARWAKARSDASYLITNKGVRIDRTGMVRKTNKPSSTVMIDDILTFRKGSEIKTVRVLGLPNRRGSAEEAKTHYEFVELEET